MTSRPRGRPKREQPKREQKEASGGFNAPFRALEQALAHKATTSPRPPAGAPQAGAAEREQADGRAGPDVGSGAEHGRSEPAGQESEELASALAGVAPLAPGPRRVPRRPRTELPGPEADERRDRDALDRAEGFDVAFHDHYVRARAQGVSRETLASLEKGRFPIQAHLDLHGLALDDARHAVDAFLREQQRLGRRCVLLVTGKGKNSPGMHGVLREKVPEWLARGPSSRRILAFASARPCDGGLGALVVLMRAGSSRKNRIDVESGGVGALET